MCGLFCISIDSANAACILCGSNKPAGVAICGIMPFAVKPTKTNIQRELQRFVRESYRCSEMLLHYAGHGTNVRDTSGDEDDQKDEVLVPSDFRQNGYITDDYINLVLQKLNPKCRVILLFDCCHSGTIADIQYQTQEPGKFTLKNQNKIQAPIVMYSGCTDPQQSADAYNINNQKKWSGAMTSSFIRALQPYIYKTQSVYQTLDNIRSFLKAKRYIQLPQLSVTNPNKLQLIGKNGFIQPARRRNAGPGGTACRRSRAQPWLSGKRSSRVGPATTSTGDRRI